MGGGLGRAYANPDTFARLADPMTFVTYDEVEEVIAAVLVTYRELGDRTDRKRARMKYVVADMGYEQFRKEIEVRLGRELREPLALPTHFEADDHLGWRTRDDGTHQVGVRVSAGRVRDDETTRLRTALRLDRAASPGDVLPHPATGHRDQRHSRRARATTSKRSCARHGVRSDARTRQRRTHRPRLSGPADVRSGPGRGRTATPRTGRRTSKARWRLVSSVAGLCNCA